MSAPPRLPRRYVDKSLNLTAVTACALLLVACGGKAAPPPQSATPYVAKNAIVPAMSYRLPVVGDWRVFRTHYGSQSDQAYAVDLVIDSSPRGFRLKQPEALARGNSAFQTYGQLIVADGPGVVVIAADGVPENVPGVVNKYDMHGNFVVIDHENGEFSLMAHFIPGSLKVRAGHRVVAGTPLGLCGNSGHSTEPHLHWQIMDNIHASQARGIPPRLLPYEKNGTTTVDIPQKGDVITGP